MATSSTSDALAGATEATEFGAAIRDMRVAHNTDLATVASTLRIRQVYLQAIEDGRFNDLPGPTYAAGFVRAYAEFLGLDLTEVMRRYREVALGTDRQAPLVAPSPVVEGTMPTGFILLVGAVLAVVAYGSWYYLTLSGRDAGNIVAQLPQNIADIVGMETTAPDVVAEPAKPIVQPEPVSEPVMGAAQGPSDQLLPANVEETTTAVDPQEPSEVAAVEPAPVETKPSEKKPVEKKPVDNRQAQKIEEVSEPSSTLVERQRANPAPPAIVAAVPQPTPKPKPKPAPVRDIAVVAPSVPVAPIASVVPVAPIANVVERAVPAAQEAPSVPVETLTAGQGPLAPFDTIPTSAVSEPNESSFTATGIPEASQTAALPGSPIDAGGSEAASRVVLRATAISWVELRDADGKRVFSRLLKKGETYSVPGRNGITLATGNAGALDVEVDGQPIGPLGPAGAVRRNVLLEPAALLGRGNNR